MDIKQILISGVIGAAIAVWIYIQFFSPLPPEPGMSPEQQRAIESQQIASQNRIDSLSAELRLIEQRKQYYHQLYLDVNAQMQRTIDETPPEPLEINLKNLTFDEKVELFNKITK